ncbi:MAG: HupE/UreJ family protein [Verrucomicrobiota bacterium]|nr:HupE/UreJ family protein [Verrucomicrobiota bacterium]
MKKLLLITLLFRFFSSAYTHPIPDIPILGSFNSDGSSSIIIEIDPRSFAEDPESIPFITAKAFKDFPESNKTELLLKAKEMIKDAFDLRFGETSWFLPDFDLKFTEKDAGDLSEDNIVVIKGHHDTFLESNTTFYQIRAKEEAPYDLIFTNQIDGKPQRRVNVLFPGEESFKFDLGFIGTRPASETEKPVVIQPAKTISKEEQAEQRRADARSTFFSFTRQGFVHVLPLGLDHILFVLGLFFLSRKWKPIIYQVSVFTIAHTITLGLATLDLVAAPSHVVEPIIAASIAVVAIENIFFPGYRHMRLLVVFFFGLIHGLGFAGALSAFDLDPTSLVIGLLGFNVGVEFGQLAVIALVFGATFWLAEEKAYRKWVVIPGSLLIALMGIYWTIERVFF